MDVLKTCEGRTRIAIKDASKIDVILETYDEGSFGFEIHIGDKVYKMYKKERDSVEELVEQIKEVVYNRQSTAAIEDELTQ